MENESVVSEKPLANTLVDVSMITVEVAYAATALQVILPVEVNKHTTVEEAIIASGILMDFPEIDLKKNKVGIFSQLTQLTHLLNHKDRIEIYRKLIADPKEIRKQRALEGKKMKKGS
ncbi:MAG: RnfH family protein [gamma proteobacterium symbiont of Taylorina sp.]|nr:RnfH family protein [gamma proteobacterium symbiont of Taylorina sp.]